MAYSVTKAAGAQKANILLFVLTALGLHLMKTLAATQGPKVRVNAILPGLLMTEWVCSVLEITRLH